VVHQSCIPQYAVGHVDRVRRARAQLAETRPRVTALGSSFGGVGITDCVGNAAKAAAAFEKSLVSE
jgi:oxygen-dependent protoporphyrinogen oxidase